MLTDDGLQPILMDLGSLVPSPTPITSRSQAVAVQDQAAEHSTMPYRAPELFDVKSDTVIDTKVDIWSLGCTLYACLVGKSPFEASTDESGGSLSMAVLGGYWRFPDEDGQGRKGTPLPGGQVISDGTRRLVRECLKLEPTERPDIDHLMEMVEDVIRTLPEA
jgi:serine/threonine kinase 16